MRALAILVGVYVWPQGHKYDGEWVENRMHGQGVFTSAAGEKWVGEFSLDSFKNESGQFVSTTAFL
jgi:hypothetical protein